MAKDSEAKTSEPADPQPDPKTALKNELPKPDPEQAPGPPDPYVPAAGDPSLKEIEAERAKA